MATTYEVGKKLVELCNAHKNMEAVETLYADDIVSIEAMSMPGHPLETKGKSDVKKKGEQFFAMHEIHSSTASEPLANGDKFCCWMEADVTAKDGPMKGQRMKMKEYGLFTVKNGKITREEFFYGTDKMC